MKSFQMKALALAMLGLGGLVMAGSALAVCPDPTAFSNKGYATPNGPWARTRLTFSISPGEARIEGQRSQVSGSISPGAGGRPGSDPGRPVTSAAGLAGPRLAGEEGLRGVRN